MIPTPELTTMQTEANTFLDKPCQIQRRTATSDGMGHNSETWNTINTVNCSLSLPTGSFMQNLADRLSSLTTWLVAFPYGTDVRLGDQLVIGSDTLTVQANYTPQSYPIYTHVMASEIKVK